MRRIESRIRVADFGLRDAGCELRAASCEEYLLPKLPLRKLIIGFNFEFIGRIDD